MTEKEFLEKRIPIWLEGDDLHISTPSNMDKNDYRNLSRQFKEKYHDLPSFNITYKNDYAITENGDTIK